MINKRVFGYLSWRLHRAGIHRVEVLEALREDLMHLRPNHVAITGDIVNISLPVEFRRAGEWLRTLGEPADVTVVPGNHDAYVHVSWDRSWAHWQEFMSSDGHPPLRQHRTPADAVDRDFPIVRRRGPMAIIGLSTAEPTAPGRSSGSVGHRQLELLAGTLREEGEAGHFRVVLLHHPPNAANAPESKRLTDAQELQQVIAEAGAELVLHGHEHRLRMQELTGRCGVVPVFGVASASLLPQGTRATAGQYHLHYIARHPDGWSMETHIRGFDVRQHRFIETHRLQRVLPRPAVEATSPGSTPVPAV
jgi:3',5'-cyclic AMP phosphodiesterase CpdA